MVAIIDYGAGNIGSLVNALGYIGVKYAFASTVPTEGMPGHPDQDIHYILPGVGSFGKGMENLKHKEMVEWLKNLDKPLLGICLGYQLLSEGSDEDGGVQGLGRIKGWCTKLSEPHVGWDEWERKDYYFVHHYQNMSQPYAIKQGNLWGCQFHPEKSQKAGLQFLKEFCES